MWYIYTTEYYLADFATPWTVAHQAPWNSPGKNTGVGSHSSGIPSPGDLPDPGTELRSPAMLEHSLLSLPLGSPKKKE